MPKTVNNVIIIITLEGFETFVTSRFVAGKVATNGDAADNL